MKIIISSGFHITKLSPIERKLVRKRIAELKACNNLGEVKYGRLHLLRGKYAGAFGIRIGQLSRLILFPIEIDPAYKTTKHKHLKYYVVAVLVCYSPNHYHHYF